MKVLIIGLNYAPEMIGAGVYTAGLAEFLATKNHSVKVIAAMPYYPAWKVMEGWPKFRYLRRRTPSAVDITHVPLYVPDVPNGLRRIVHTASFTLAALPVAVWHALVKRPDIVLVVAPSLISGITGWIAARFAGAKKWLHIQDFEVEAAIATGLLKKETFLSRAANGFEKWMLTRFDKVSSISPPMVARLIAKGVAPYRTYEFRNWADLSSVSPLNGLSSLKGELKIETPFVALYSGNIANKQGIEIIVEMSRHLVHRSDLTIIICGNGPTLAQLKDLARDFPFIRFIPLQPLDRLNDLLGMADVHLLPQIGGTADLLLPSKLTNILASGRPVLATTHSNTALGQEVIGCGEIVAPGDAIGMAKALEALLDDPIRRAELGLAARQRAIEKWDGASILEGVHVEMQRLTNKILPVKIQNESRV